jgi:hypothetical protein
MLHFERLPFSRKEISMRYLPRASHPLPLLLASSMSLLGLVGSICLLCSPARLLVPPVTDPSTFVHVVDGSGSDSTAIEADEATRALVSMAYSKLPLSFEANHGQTDPRVKFISHGSGYSLFLTANEAVLTLKKGADERTRDSISIPHPSSSSMLRMRLAGANDAPPVSQSDQLPGKVNYFIGSDPEKWQTEIPTYARVLYKSVYPGIDLAYYGNQRQLEYDFIVAPGADPQNIRFAYDGADKIEVVANGDLLLHTTGGMVRQHKPVVYQEAEGVRQEISSAYVLKGEQEIGFQLGAYDASQPLVIDPVLSYSTFFGGSGSDTLGAIALDAAGNIYVVGDSSSDDFPITPHAFQQVIGGTGGFGDLTVTKLNSTGKAIVYSTFIGGNGDDTATSIAVDKAGNALVTGYTGPSNGSTDFPTTPNALRRTKTGFADGLVIKLSATGNRLLYSTYLGGTLTASNSTNVDNYVYGVAVDPSNNFYVTGSTRAKNFPTTSGAFHKTFGGGPANDAFVTKFTPAAALSYSTYLGGNAEDVGRGIAVDSLGNAYVTGNTRSPNFPVRNALYPNLKGSLDDVFVTKLNAAGSALVYSTYLGSDGNDQGFGIATDSTRNAYVTGFTRSPNFPVKNGAQPNYGGNGNGLFPADAFVTKFNADGSALLYSSFLGGTGADTASAIAVDNSGKAVITGQTFSNFPVKNAIQPNPAGSFEAFVARFDTALSGPGSLLYSTYLGGSNFDAGMDVALDGTGNAIVVGMTGSPNFKRFDPLQQFYNGGASDGFISKIANSGAAPTPTPTPSTIALTSGLTRTGSINQPAQNSGTLGITQYTIVVPSGSTRLQVNLIGNQDVDLFVRFGQRVVIQNGNVIADYRSESFTGKEAVTITPASSTPLRPGTYYIGVVNFGPGAANYAVTATVTP